MFLRCFDQIIYEITHLIRLVLVIDFFIVILKGLFNFNRCTHDRLIYSALPTYITNEKLYIPIGRLIPIDFPFGHEGLRNYRTVNVYFVYIKCTNSDCTYIIFLPIRCTDSNRILYFGVLDRYLNVRECIAITFASYTHIL